MSADTYCSGISDAHFGEVIRMRGNDSNDVLTWLAAGVEGADHGSRLDTLEHSGMMMCSTTLKYREDSSSLSVGGKRCLGMK